MKRITEWLLSLLCVAILISCSTVAFTWRKWMLLYSNSEIASLSTQSYYEFMSTSAPSTNMVTTSMIRDVGNRLAKALDRYLAAKGESDLLDDINWEFYLVRSNQANAFCLPDGKVVFYEGIMPVLTTPDLIAVVMSHEMGHAIARHGNERMTQQALSNMVGAVTGMIIGQKTSETGRAVFETAYAIGSQYGYLLPFSRKHELEADEIGLYIMAIAGYDITQAPLLWEKMAQAKTTDVPEVLSTHPSDAKRMKNLQQLIEKARKYSKSN